MIIPYKAPPAAQCSVRPCNTLPYKNTSKAAPAVQCPVHADVSFDALPPSLLVQVTLLVLAMYVQSRSSCESTSTSASASPRAH